MQAELGLLLFFFNSRYCLSFGYPDPLCWFVLLSSGPTANTFYLFYLKSKAYTAMYRSNIYCKVLLAYTIRTELNSMPPTSGDFSKSNQNTKIIRIYKTTKNLKLQ